MVDIQISQSAVLGEANDLVLTLEAFVEVVDETALWLVEATMWS